MFFFDARQDMAIGVQRNSRSLNCPNSAHDFGVNPCQEPGAGYCNVVTLPVSNERLYYLSMEQVDQFRNLLNFPKVMDDL